MNDYAAAKKELEEINRQLAKTLTDKLSSFTQSYDKRLAKLELDLKARMEKEVEFYFQEVLNKVAELTTKVTEYQRHTSSTVARLSSEVHTKTQELDALLKEAKRKLLKIQA